MTEWAQTRREIPFCKNDEQHCGLTIVQTEDLTSGRYRVAHTDGPPAGNMLRNRYAEQCESNPEVA